MLSYEAFKDYVRERVLDTFPPGYENAEVRIENVVKANAELSGLSVWKEDTTLAPNLYLNPCYEDYVNGMSLDEVVDLIAKSYVKAIDEMKINEEIGARLKDAEYVRNHVIFELVGREQNAELITERPNRDFLDLSIVYTVIVGMDEKGVAASAVTNELMEEFSLTEEELYQAAYENTRTLYQPKILDLVDVIGPDEACEKNYDKIFLLTNSMVIGGSVMMIYDDALQKLANALIDPEKSKDAPREILVVPSSRHEVLGMALIDSDMIGHCQQILQDINSSCVGLEDRLSNNVYKYDADEHVLTMATDVPNRRLDDMEQTKNMSI